jgi:peptidoglycan/LPS O-acetylase OafA/YrhL
MAESATLRGRLSELDALRGIGALLVLNFHFSTRFHEMFPAAHHVRFHIGGGNYRVLLFFAISGFAIYFSTAKMKTAWDFIVGRAARLLPAYWAAMVLTILIVHGGHVGSLYVSPAATVINLSMLQGFFYVPAVDGSYWTLTVELAFYFCILCLWQVFRLRHIERIIAGWLAIKLCELWLWPDMPDRLALLLNLKYVCFFAIGMVTYRVWAKERSWAQQLPVLALILGVIAASETPDILLVSLIILAAFWAMVEGRLRWLCLSPLIWVGQISYSLYLVHQNIGFTIMLKADEAGLDPLVGYGLALGAAFVLGALVNRIVERPASRYLLGLWKSRQASHGLVAAGR